MSFFRGCGVCRIADLSFLREKDGPSTSSGRTVWIRRNLSDRSWRRRRRRLNRNCPYLYATSGGEVGEVEVRGEGCGQCFGRERRDDRQPAQPANAADFRDDRLAILDRVADEGKSMDRDAAAFQRFARQQAVVDSAEAGAGAADPRNLPACEKIGIQKGAGERAGDAARAFDEAVVGGERKVGE